MTAMEPTETTTATTAATTTTVINPADHQVSPDFPPDKSKEWPYPPEEESGRISHRALRHELDLLNTAVSALHQNQTRLERWHLKAIQQALVAGHLARISGRLRAEQDLLIPILSQRYIYPKTLSQDLQPRVLACIDALQPRWKALKVDDTVSEELYLAWTTYLETVTDLLDEKERTLFVLNRHYFTQVELKDTKGLQMYTRSHKWDVASLAYEMGTDWFCNVFMEREQVPWFMWTLYFKGQLAVYERELVHNSHALALNVPPNNSAEFRALVQEMGAARVSLDRVTTTTTKASVSNNDDNKDRETRVSVVVAVSAS